MLQVDDRDNKDRGDSGISRSTRSSSSPSRHPSSKWAYRTINLHPDSETEYSEKPSPRRKKSVPKLKQTPRKKKSKELPVVRGIPRVLRRVKTETMLMAGKYYYKPWSTDSFSRYKTRVIPNNVCIVISTQFNLNCIFRIDLIHLQQKSLQEYVKTITCTRILNTCARYLKFLYT